MQVRLIRTEGRGGVAEIDFAGRRLRVVDGVSRAERPRAAGVLPDVRLEVVVNPHLTRRAPPAAPATDELQADHGWRYRAWAEVVATDPLRADVGALQLEVELGSGEAWAVGDRIELAIDRIVLTRAGR